MQLTWEGIHLSSIRQINGLPDEIKHALYRSLIPGKRLEKCCIAFPDGPDLFVRIRCPENTGSVEIDIRHRADAIDPLLYVQMADTAHGQLEVILVIVNDPAAPRFDVDRDWKGELTKLGTTRRNVPAEIEAMNAGLAPGQVRKGLRMLRHFVPRAVAFVSAMGQDMIIAEPLAYNNAIVFEGYGFNYIRGRRKMAEINEGFQPGGEYFEKLDGSTPFRQPGLEKTVRGRSWAIHDGILGEPWRGIEMYRRVEPAAICTFPDCVY